MSPLRTVAGDRDSALTTPWTHDALGMDIQAAGFSVTGNITWVANLASYVPFVLARPKLVAQLFWLNGTTAAGNTDVGVYDEGLNKIISTGSTANSGTTTLQAVNVTDTLLQPGRYWLALASDSSTHIYQGDSIIARALDYFGVKQQASGWSSGLLTTPTFAVPAQTLLPIYGFTPGSVV